MISQSKPGISPESPSQHSLTAKILLVLDLVLIMVPTTVVVGLGGTFMLLWAPFWNEKLSDSPAAIAIPILTALCLAATCALWMLVVNELDQAPHEIKADRWRRRVVHAGAAIALLALLLRTAPPGFLPITDRPSVLSGYFSILAFGAPLLISYAHVFLLRNRRQRCKAVGTAPRSRVIGSQMSGADAYKVNSLIIGADSDPLEGHAVWDPARSLWNGGMLMVSLLLAPQFITTGAVLVYLVLLLLTMCAGHSVGFHRRLIHRTFQCPKSLERVLVWLGTLVGMQGPLWIIHAHDIRDWAQRQPDCHDYLKHGRGLAMDAWWNLHCRLRLDHPPAFDPGPDIADDGFYRFLQNTWMLQQLPLAILLFAAGGLPWVIWGICARVTTGVTMHWFVGYLCHTRGPQSWLVDDGAVQAHDVPWAAIPSFGESWHNNHHAFPASARHGLYPGQVDLGFAFIRLLERCGLAWNIQTPDSLPPRPGITPLTAQAASGFPEMERAS